MASIGGPSAVVKCVDERTKHMSYVRNGALLAIGFVAGASLMVTGCGSQQAAESPTGQSQATDGPEIPENMSGIAELAQAEQEAALQQEICPVSEKPLGSMGKPGKVTVKDQEVFVCCGGCVDPVKQDPEKYLAKLEGK